METVNLNNLKLIIVEKKVGEPLIYDMFEYETPSIHSVQFDMIKSFRTA